MVQNTEAVYLTKDDAKVLREWINKLKTGKVDPLPRSPIPRNIAAPDSFACLPPVDSGIPELIKGIGGAADVPGSAVCSVYRVSVDESGNATLVSAGFDVTVYNLGAQVAPHDWAFIQRDRFGDWWITHYYYYGAVLGQLKGAITSSNTTCTIDNVVTLHGVSPLDDPTDTTEELEVSLLLCFTAPDNAVTIAWYDSGTWRGFPTPSTTTCP